MEASLRPDTQIGMPELQRSELLDAARAQALQDLQLGGGLDRETQNLIARASGVRAGQGGFLGTRMGRDLSARDLGLTSLQLQQQRLGTAAQLGQGEEATNLAQQGLAAQIAQTNAQLGFQSQQARATAIGFLEDLKQREFANTFGVASFTQSVPRPVAGLDPGSLASAAVGDVNAANQAAMQAAGLKFQESQQRAAIFNSFLGAAIPGSTGNKLLGTALTASAGGGCWVARSVYGTKDARWRRFRAWLLEKAPLDVIEFYLTFGPEYARHVSATPYLRKQLKKSMDKIIADITLDDVNRVERMVGYGAA